MYSQYESFKKYEVKPCESLKEFCDTYHRRGAYHDRGEDYMKCDYESHKKDMEVYGFTFIPKGSSTTGDNVSYYGKI